MIDYRSFKSKDNEDKKQYRDYPVACRLGFAGHAQIGEQRQNFAVGFNGGININSVSFSPTVRQKSLMGINGGLTARYISEKYFSMICGCTSRTKLFSTWLE